MSDQRSTFILLSRCAEIFIDDEGIARSQIAFADADLFVILPRLHLEISDLRDGLIKTSGMTINRPFVRRLVELDDA